MLGGMDACRGVVVRGALACSLSNVLLFLCDRFIGIPFSLP